MADDENSSSIGKAVQAQDAYMKEVHEMKLAQFKAKPPTFDLTTVKIDLDEKKEYNLTRVVGDRKEKKGMISD